MRKIFAILTICALLAGVFSLNSFASQAEERYLRISATVDTSVDFVTIPVEQGNYKEFSYLGLTDVTIDLDSTVMPLEDALQGGYITVEELVARARLDAAQGLCTETSESKNGLAQFTYSYSNFRLLSIYDIYEAPDGEEHLIAYCLLYSCDNHPTYVLIDEETGEDLDYEDWGLEFAVTDASAANLTVQCTQSGGQQLGQLNVTFIQLTNVDTDEWYIALEDGADGTPFLSLDSWTPNDDGWITMEGETELTYDLTALYGELPDGNYELVLQIVDSYDAESVPSLMRNYRDMQWYVVPFTIGEGAAASDSDGISIESYTGETFSAHIMLVEDASRVYLGLSSYDGFSTDKPGKYLSTAIEDEGAAAAINAGLYNDDGTSGSQVGSLPLGLTVHDGEAITIHSSNGTTAEGFCGFDSENKLVVAESMTEAEALELGIRDGCTAGPVLIANGLVNESAYSADSGYNPRTVIGQLADGTVIFICADGRQEDSVGATYQDMIDLLLDYGAVNACCMTGGMDSLMLYREPETNKVTTVNSPSVQENAIRMPTFWLVSPAD